MAESTLHKINCVTACVTSCYTIYNILCNVSRPFLAIWHVVNCWSIYRPQEAGLPLVGFLGIFLQRVMEIHRCERYGSSETEPKQVKYPETRCFRLAYNLPACCYMLGGPLGPERAERRKDIAPFNFS